MRVRWRSSRKKPCPGVQRIVSSRSKTTGSSPIRPSVADATIDCMDGATYRGALAAAPRVAEHFARHIEAARATAVGSVAFAPDEKSLEAIIDAAFWASLRREEGYAPKISLAFLPPEQAVRPLMFERPLALGARGACARGACRRTLRHSPRRVAARRAAVGLGHDARDSRVLLRARGGLARAARHQAPSRRHLGQVRQRRGARRRPAEDRGRGDVEPAGLSAAPDVARRLRAAGFVGRVGERPRPAGGLDARARARRGAAGGAGGQRHVARVDRPADFVQHRAQVQRARRSDAGRLRRSAPVAGRAGLGRRNDCGPDGGRRRDGHDGRSTSSWRSARKSRGAKAAPGSNPSP